VGDKSRRLKTLTSRRAKLSRDLKSVYEKRPVDKHVVSVIKGKMDKATKEIEKIQKGTIIISEHALLRYLQYVYKLDVETIETEILSDATISMMKGMGNGKYGVGSDLMAILVDNTVVSIVPRK
jgi:hypothetical protein